MKKIRIGLVILLFLEFTLGFSQEKSKMIELPKFYKGEGVIFNKSAPYPFKKSDYKKPYTPTIEDVKKAENFLFENYYDYELKVLTYFKYDKSLIQKLLKSKYKEPKKVKKKFCKYNRQYAGYINYSNDTIIYIGLLNFSRIKKAEQRFTGWKDELLMGFGDFYEKNQAFYNINMNKKDFVYRLE